MGRDTKFLGSDAIGQDRRREDAIEYWFRKVLSLIWFFLLFFQCKGQHWIGQRRAITIGPTRGCDRIDFLSRNFGNSVFGLLHWELSFSIHFFPLGLRGYSRSQSFLPILSYPILSYPRKRNMIGQAREGIKRQERKERGF